MAKLDRLLARLESAKTDTGSATRVLPLVADLARADFRDPKLLIRYHDALLFLRAYPQSPAVLRQAERLLGTFSEREERLRASGAGMDDWENYDQEGRLAATLARFIPLLADDADVEADVPYREWLRAAAGRQHELLWLLSRFEQLPITGREKTEL